MTRSAVRHNFARVERMSAAIAFERAINFARVGPRVSASKLACGLGYDLSNRSYWACGLGYDFRTTWRTERAAGAGRASYWVSWRRRPRRPRPRRRRPIRPGKGSRHRRKPPIRPTPTSPRLTARTPRPKTANRKIPRPATPPPRGSSSTGASSMSTHRRSSPAPTSKARVTPQKGSSTEMSWSANDKAQRRLRGHGQAAGVEFPRHAGRRRHECGPAAADDHGIAIARQWRQPAAILRHRVGRDHRARRRLDLGQDVSGSAARSVAGAKQARHLPEQVAAAQRAIFALVSERLQPGRARLSSRCPASSAARRAITKPTSRPN